MALLETLRAKAPQSPTLADVAARLHEAERELADVEARHGLAALEAFQSPDTLAGIQRDLMAARDRVELLRAAHKAAINREEQETRRQRAALQKAQVAAVRKHLEARNKAASALVQRIEDVAALYRTLLEASAKAQAACPVGIAWPGGSLCADGELRGLVQAEFYRASAQPGDKDRRALPGSQSPHVNLSHDPKAIPAMDQAVVDASAFVLATLTGKAPE